MRPEIRSLIGKSQLLSFCVALLSLTRPNSHLKSIGWYQSFYRRMPVDADDSPLPWFTYGSITFLSERIHREMRVFEFGSGNSTLWWSQRVAHIVSCEHDRDWFERMQPRLGHNVTSILADIPTHQYRNTISSYTDTFDIVVIDGRDRVECAKNAIPALKSDGIIVWDNSDRDQYQEGYDHLKQNGFRRLDFQGPGPINAYGWATSIFYRPKNCLGL